MSWTPARHHRTLPCSRYLCCIITSTASDPVVCRCCRDDAINSTCTLCREVTWHLQWSNSNSSFGISDTLICLKSSTVVLNQVKVAGPLLWKGCREETEFIKGQDCCDHHSTKVSVWKKWNLKDKLDFFLFFLCRVSRWRRGWEQRVWFTRITPFPTNDFDIVCC